MKRFLALTLFTVSLFGQGGVIINHPTSAIRGVTIGATYCYFYSQLPAPGSVHVGCWLNNVLTLNHVDSVTTTKVTGAFTFATGTITWQFTPGIAPNSINYKITGTVLPNPGNEPNDIGTF